MSANGYLIEAATRHQVFLQRFAGGQVKLTLPILKRMAAEIRAALSGQDLTSFQTARLTALQLEITAITKAAGVKMEATITPNLTELAVYESQFTQKMLQGAVTVSVAGLAPTLVTQAVLTKPLKLVSGQKTTITTMAGLYDTFAAGAAAEVMTAVNAGMIAGRTTQQITAEVMGMVNSRSRRQAEAVVRTATNHAGNVARAETYRANADIIAKEEFVATLDGATTITCFPAETNVLAVGVVERIIRTQYTGDMITIRTSSGYKLSGTPNHPILTSQGVVPLGKLKPSDKVVTSALGKLSPVLGGDNVGMIAPIGEIFNSLSKASVFDSFGKSATAADLYGDGEFCNGEITVINTDCFLRDDGVPVIGKNVMHNLFGLVEDSAALSTLSGAFLAVFGLNPADMPAQIPVCLVQEFIDLALVDSGLELNSARLLSAIKELKNSLSIINSLDAFDTSGKALSYSALCEKASDGSGCSIQPSGDTGARLSGPITVDDVTEVSVELVSCHVYTLSVLGQELYIAEGVLVKNCASLDGNQYPVGEGPQPAMHYGCRSVRVPVLDPAFAALREGATRASMTGPVSAQTTYGGFLKRQSAEFQEEVLGVERAKLFRSGKVSIDRFTDDGGKVYTLEQLAAREGLTLD